MDDREFRDLLNLFPIVRSRNYCADIEVSKQSASSSKQNEQLSEWQNAWNEMDQNDGNWEGIDIEDPFWEKLRLAVEKKVGLQEADKFCKAFQKVHKKLVYEELSLDAARRFINASGSSTG